jgi:hypothetical protein
VRVAEASNCGCDVALRVLYSRGVGGRWWRVDRRLRKRAFIRRVEERIRKVHVLIPWIEHASHVPISK